MKYMVFDYIGKGALYLVPENDKAELQLVEEYMLDYPGNVEKIGVMETTSEFGCMWWTAGKRPEKRRPISSIRSRNADYL